MSTILKGFVGWTVVPDLVTKNGLYMIHAYIFPLLNIKVPAANSYTYRQHYQWTYAIVVLGYLLYTLFEGATTLQPNFYEILGVLPDVDDNGLKVAFKNFARKNHPDRPGVGRQGEELFMAVRDAFEALKDPTVRFAYDRFGPDVIHWSKLSTPREYMRKGLMQSSGYHIFSGVILAVISSIGRPSSVKYWRYLLYWSFFALELAFILYPTPSSSDHTIDISFKNFFHLIFPNRVPYQHVLFLHRVFMFLSLALSRVAPRLFPDDPRSEYEIVLQHLTALAGFGDREASIILHSDLHAAHAHEVEGSISSGTIQPCMPTPDVMDSLAREMENMIIETRLQENIPPLKRAREAAIERERTGKEGNIGAQMRMALPKSFGGDSAASQSKPDGNLPSPRPSPPRESPRRSSSYVRARSPNVEYQAIISSSNPGTEQHRSVFQMIARLSADELQRAEKLKEEGNLLFAAGKFSEALGQYNEAISIDDSNAAYYCNRSACRIKLKQYIDAATDAEIAIHLNPNYTKAYGRLASARYAMNQSLLSKLAWQKALDCLPKTNLTESELKLQKEYKAGLAAAERTAKGRSTFSAGAGVKSEMMMGMDRDTPWLRGMLLMPLLTRQRNYSSSAFNVVKAHADWEAGNLILNLPARSGRVLEGLELLSDGLMRDWRVFNVPGSSWYIKLEQLMRTASSRLNAWVFDDANTVVRELEGRVSRDGWDSMRPVLSLTVRSWVILGHIESNSKGNFGDAVALYNKAIKVIKFVRKTWPGVGDDVRGEVFRDTFLRTVQTMHMEPHMKLCARENNMKRRNELLEELLDEIKEVLKGVEAQRLPSRESDPTFVLANYDYPKGRSLGMKGFYYRRKLEEAAERGGSDEVDRLIEQTATTYVEGAAALPLDDEYHCWFLNTALNLMQQVGVPKKQMKEPLALLKAALPDMQKIWATSSLGTQGRDGYIQDTIDRVEGL
ncbi:hypothetical protein V5O48_001573 [Marasmius crinis-equi]|uniref:J domain-containing protein n=1 Tax=Marasmius crinis-equi TaxID=585013 RepID=A0ABR3FY00_9AGAR